MSKPVDMVAGLFYYIEAVHASRGDKTDEFRVGVVPPSQKTQFPIKKDSLRQFRPSKIDSCLKLCIPHYPIIKTKNKSQITNHNK